MSGTCQMNLLRFFVKVLFNSLFVFFFLICRFSYFKKHSLSWLYSFFTCIVSRKIMSHISLKRKQFIYSNMRLRSWNYGCYEHYEIIWNYGISFLWWGLMGIFDWKLIDWLMYRFSGARISHWNPRYMGQTSKH